MVRIRLRRQGLKGQPSYRIIVADKRKARNGGFIENIGYYNPRTRPATEVIEEERALYWLSVGAQPSEAVQNLMKHTGTWERFERLRAGESIEELVKEAEESEQELPSPRTNYPAPAEGESVIKAREAARLAADAAEEESAETEAPTEDTEEAEAPAEDSDDDAGDAEEAEE